VTDVDAQRTEASHKASRDDPLSQPILERLGNRVPQSAVEQRLVPGGRTRRPAVSFPDDGVSELQAGRAMITAAATLDRWESRRA
jgi:hypothetical protein